ncbi:MAG: tetratricopeptide repeat protein [Anaerolineales bacterium]|nr:tetratricopeptide repeat protein [Anaerolineales bacterium]
MSRNIHPTPFVIHSTDELGKNIDLKNLSRNLATKYADGHVVTDDDLQIMGRNLWNGLSAEVQGAFEAARKETGEKILPVVIHSDAADVQALPWETLFHPKYGFIGKNPDFTLTRRSSTQEAMGELDQGPLRVLLFTSLPANVDPERSRLKVEEEQAEFQAALLPWTAQGLVTLEMPDDGRFSTLQNLLKEFQPHVLFLSGHGNFHHMPHAKEVYGEFFFEDEAGDSMGIKEDEIATALRGTDVQAVILSACESGKAASDELSNGLTRKISAAGIPHVIGMREAIYDVAGIQFACALCDSLARQERMDVALQAARIAIQSPFKDVARASSFIGDELSYGQWCLPLLISSAPSRALIDWDFTPREVEARAVSHKINTVVMPARFIGRRAEMRKFKNSLLAGKIHSLLITGPGGQGKTSLAGKLALDLQAHGYRLFAWSARPENSWRDFELEMEQTLDRPRVDRYDKFLPRAENESARAQFMLDLLMEQFNGRVVLFLDNLETIQDPDTLALKDTTVEAWLRAANQAQGVILLVTSRWQIPDWSGEHEPLTHVNYGDFLQIAQRLLLPSAFLTRRNSLRQVYNILGGNVRGLEFFAAAIREMENADEENAFLEKLSTVKEDLQANMAIEAIYSSLSTDAKTLLHRLPAFHEPVPMEGLLKLALDLPNPEFLLERLLAVSLLEASYEPHWKVDEYQCPQMVVDWMRGKGLVDDGHKWLNVVADYHLVLHKNKRESLSQAVRTHYALQRVKRNSEADRLALDYIVMPMTIAGLYNILLTEWLPKIRNSQDLKTRADAFNQTGKLYIHVGDHETALPYLERSLIFSKQIGDKIGEGNTLINLSQVYDVRGDYETALSYLEQSLTLQLSTGNRYGESITLNNIATIYSTRGDYEAALKYYNEDLKICQQINNKHGESIALNNIANIYHTRGDYKTELDYRNKDISICRQIGDKAGESTALNNISQIYAVQGDYATALLYLKQSLAIRQKIGDKLGEGTTLDNISNIYREQSEYEEALLFALKALTIAQQVGNKMGEGTILNNISQIYTSCGEYSIALEYLEKALEIKQQIGDKLGIGTVLNNISQLYDLQGEYETALLYLRQSLDIRQQIGDKIGEGATLNNISGIYWARGDYETALSFLNQALDIRRHINDKAGEGTTLNNISGIYWAQGDIKNALYYLEQALAVQEQIGDKAGEGRTLSNLSQIYDAQGNRDKAILYAQRAYAIQKQIGDKAGEGISFSNISQVYDAQGDYKTALSYLEKSIAIQEEIGDKAGLCNTLFKIGRILIKDDQIDEAVKALTSSYLIANQIALSEGLQALAKIAPQVGLPEGLDGWEKLAQRIQSGKE